MPRLDLYGHISPGFRSLEKARRLWIGEVAPQRCTICFKTPASEMYVPVLRLGERQVKVCPRCTFGLMWLSITQEVELT